MKERDREHHKKDIKHTFSSVIKASTSLSELAMEQKKLEGVIHILYLQNFWNLGSPPTFGLKMVYISINFPDHECFFWPTPPSPPSI